MRDLTVSRDQTPAPSLDVAIDFWLPGLSAVPFVNAGAAAGDRRAGGRERGALSPLRSEPAPRTSPHSPRSPARQEEIIRCGVAGRMRDDERSRDGQHARVPTPEPIAEANVTRLTRKAAAARIDELRRMPVKDIDWFWDLVVQDLGIPSDEPYTRVRDSSDGIEWTRWFIDCRLNVATACIDRWRADPQTAGRAALVHEDDRRTGTTGPTQRRPNAHGRRGTATHDRILINARVQWFAGGGRVGANSL